MGHIKLLWEYLTDWWAFLSSATAISVLLWSIEAISPPMDQHFWRAVYTDANSLVSVVCRTMRHFCEDWSQTPLWGQSSSNKTRVLLRKTIGLNYSSTQQDVVVYVNVVKHNNNNEHNNVFWLHVSLFSTKCWFVRLATYVCVCLNIHLYGNYLFKNCTCSHIGLNNMASRKIYC